MLQKTGVNAIARRASLGREETLPPKRPLLLLAREGLNPNGDQHASGTGPLRRRWSRSPQSGPPTQLLSFVFGKGSILELALITVK